MTTLGKCSESVKNEGYFSFLNTLVSPWLSWEGEGLNREATTAPENYE